MTATRQDATVSPARARVNAPRPACDVAPVAGLGSLPDVLAFAVYGARAGSTDLTFRSWSIERDDAEREAALLAYDARWPHVRVVTIRADGSRDIAWDNRDLAEMMADIDLYETGRIAGAR